MKLRAPITALLACAATGCFHNVPPDLGQDRAVDVGVPQTWGSPQGDTLDWDFGDGAHARGAAVSHAYAAPGHVVVRALRDGESVAHVTLEVVPRPVIHAIPGAADGAFFLPHIRGRLESAVDFAEKLVGPDSLQRFLDASVLAAVALANPGAAGDGGIGLFTLPSFKGLVGLVAVRDPAAVLHAVEQRFTRMGAGFAQAPDGSYRIGGPSGETFAVLLDRGYVYLIVPQPGGSGTASAEPAAAVDVIRRADNQGIESLVAPVDGLATATGVLYLRLNATRQAQVRTLLATATVSGGNSLSLDGRLVAPAPLWDTQRSPGSPLLHAAPEGFVALASVSASPEDLARVVTGLLADPERAAALTRWGFSADDIGALAATLAGDAAVLAYFDPVGFYGHLAEPDARPEPRGSLWGRAGLVHPDVLERLLRAHLSAAQGQGPGSPFALPLGSVPGGARLRVAGDVLEIAAGDPPSSKRTVDVPAAFAERYGPGAFGEGHVSVYLDLGQLLHQLELPLSVPGISPARLSILQAIATEFARRLTPIDQVFLDIVPDASGARVRGKLTLRPR